LQSYQVDLKFYQVVLTPVKGCNQVYNSAFQAVDLLICIGQQYASANEYFYLYFINA
jgi:hypothetical protein